MAKNETNIRAVDGGRFVSVRYGLDDEMKRSLVRGGVVATRDQFEDFNSKLPSTLINLGSWLQDNPTLREKRAAITARNVSLHIERAKKDNA